MRVCFYEDITPRGLTNQIIFLVDYLRTLLNVHGNESTTFIVILPYFFNDLNNHQLLTPMSEILLFESLSNMFPQITFIDLHKLPEDFIIEWGAENTWHRIQHQHFIHFIRHYHPLSIIGIPYSEGSGIRISCQSHGFHDIQIDYRNNMLDIDRTRYYFIGMEQILTEDTRRLLRNLQFSYPIYNPLFLERPDRIPPKGYTKYHVVHLRMEDDAIQAWSENDENRSSSEQEYRSNVESAYLSSIFENIFPTEHHIIIILTANRDEKFLQQIINRGHHVWLRPYNDEIGRECNAIEDLEIATKYGNGIFVGHPRSTFSHMISIRSNCEKTIMIPVWKSLECGTS